MRCDSSAAQADHLHAPFLLFEHAIGFDIDIQSLGVPWRARDTVVR
jgi:hypothetical protein